MLNIDTDGFEMEVKFHVVDILATFNLLLGRPSMHQPDIMVVPSILHQKVMLGLASSTLVIFGDSGICSHKEDNIPVLGIMHGEEDINLWGFLFDTSGSVLIIYSEEDVL